MAQVAAEVRSLRDRTDVSPASMLHPMHDLEQPPAAPVPQTKRLTLAEQSAREQAMWIVNVQGQLDAAKRIKATREAGRKGRAK